MSPAAESRLLVVATVLLLAGLAAYAPKAVEECHDADFERYFHAGLTLAQGGDIYGAQDDRQFKYFPIFAFSMRPVVAVAGVLAGVDPTQPLTETEEVRLRWRGAAVWYVLLCASWIGSIALAVSLCRPEMRRQAVLVTLAAMAVSARFFVDNVRLGQINMIVMFFAVLGVWWMLRGRERLGGLAVAYAAALKFMPAGLLVWMVARRRWAAAAYLLAGIVLFVVVLPSFVWGWHDHQALLSRYIQSRHKMVTDLPEEHAPGQSLPSMANRLLRKVNAAALRDKHPVYINIVDWPAERAGAVATVLVLLATAAALWGVRGERDDPLPRGALEAGLFFLLLLLVSPEARRAHFVTTLVPTAALLAWGLRTGRLRAAGAVLLSAFAALALSSKGILGKGTAAILANAWGVTFWGAVILFAGTLYALRSLETKASALSTEGMK